MKRVKEKETEKLRQEFNKMSRELTAPSGRMNGNHGLQPMVPEGLREVNNYSQYIKKYKQMKHP